MSISGIERYFISRKKKLERKGYSVLCTVYRIENGRIESYGKMIIFDFSSGKILDLILKDDSVCSEVKIKQTGSIEGTITLWGSFTPKQVDDQVSKFFGS